MAGANNGQNGVINNAGQNLALRQALLATAPRMKKKLGTFTEASAPEGKTTRIKLFNTGVITKLGLVVTANVTIGVAVATVSPKAPFNAIKQIKLVDFEGTDRVNCSGYQLWQLNSVRNRTPAFYNNEGLAAVSTMPVVPTAIGTADVQFYVEVPIAYDPERDLRGAILAQTAVGEMFLNITWNDDFHQNASDEGVYNGAATSTVVVNSIAVDVFQEYLMPQSLGGQTPLPIADLLTVYEINGNFRVTDNIANGQERLTSYPNVRSVIGAYANWMNGGVMANTISAVRLIANGNQVLQENTLNSQLMEQRNWINGDLKTGTIFQNHRARPIETALYGNVQMGLTFSAAPTGTYFVEHMFESFYAKGSMLPGIGQS